MTDKDIASAVAKLERYVDEEIESIMDCTQCYSNAFENPSESNVKLCSQVHPVIWAQSDGYDFWPAKAMRCKGQEIRIRYFGDHTVDNISYEKCYKYSENPPKKSSSGKSPNIPIKLALDVKPYFI